jgi:hypothetical protein
MAHSYRKHQGDATWPTWLARLMRQRPSDGSRGAGTGQPTLAPTRGHRQSGVRRPASEGMPQSWRSAGFSEREWQRLGFLRSCYLRGQLTEFPKHQ